MFNSAGNYTSQVFLESCLFTILHGPNFILSLLYVPTGKCSFLKWTMTSSPTWNSLYLLFTSALAFYYAFIFVICCLTSSWTFFKCLANSSALALLISSLSSFINSDVVLGLIPYIIWNGDLPVLLLTKLLYENFSYHKIISHPFGLSPTKHLKKFPKLRFTTSIYPSVCGWCDKLNFKSVFNFFHNVCEKYPTNLVSQSETILLRRPCSLTTSLKNKSAI